MAITIYKNHIPPSIEHLVWGGAEGNTTYGHTRSYPGTSIYVKFAEDTRSYTRSMVAIIDNTLYLLTTEYGKNIVKISRCGDSILSGIILVADSSDNVICEQCTLEEREYIQSVLPACWVDKISYWFALCKVNLSV